MIDFCFVQVSGVRFFYKKLNVFQSFEVTVTLILITINIPIKYNKLSFNVSYNMFNHSKSLLCISIVYKNTYKSTRVLNLW